MLLTMLLNNPVEFACKQFARSVAPNFVPLQDLIARCMQDAYSGHTWVEVDSKKSAPPDLLSALQALPSCQQMTSPQVPSTVKPLVLWSNRLYLARYWSCEARLAAYLQRVIAQPVAALQADAHLDQVLAADAAGNNLGQRQAVLHAMQYQLTVISGGPGTGKTTTVRSLLSVFAATYPQARIALVAPTGKAASRLAEADQHSNADQGTIHRLLGKRPDGSLRFDANHCLAHDLVIVDEASMLDLVLADQLVSALKPTAKLVLLGDANQLDAVETGAFFHDLCSVNADQAAITGHWLCRLTHTFRFKAGSVIAQGAQALELNDGTALVSALKPSTIDVGSEGARQLAQGFEPYLKAVAAAILSDDYAHLFEAFNQYRVLVAVNEGRSGQKALAQVIDTLLREKLLQIQAPAEELPRIEIDDYQPWFVGQAILFTKNNALLNVNNGDVGIVIKEKGLDDHNDQPVGSRWMVLLLDGRRINTYLLQNYTLGWVLTVHKAQGSEFNEVAFVMPGRAVEKALLYTALTRAKERFIAYGSGADFAASASNTHPRRASIIARIQATAQQNSVLTQASLFND
jgi:exodeoxyribonuclease V alpha subunit